MKQLITACFILLQVLIFSAIEAQSADMITTDKDTRMKWWRDARFGMFIHWGLYSIPAGEWNDRTDYGEWIRNNAEIPLSEYDKLIKKFKPVKFNAEKWVKMAKDAGMKYIVITSKHHDGFCLFSSEFTDFDVMSSPYKKDILKELADACRKENIRLCFYYSIMDWQHPDYLPRRDWEKDRSIEDADFNRYIAYMKNQLKELVTNYGDIGVLWFDGEWEKTWNHDYGLDLYNYVRNLNPDIIINNRVDIGSMDNSGRIKEGFAGDFFTPEQEVPAKRLTGTDWETCMTMNDHWGFNKNDNNWKSTSDLIQKLADICSKGGNYLLNIGPTSEGTFPDQGIICLGEIGKWMKVNGEAIYGTSASPFSELAWGRCTMKKIGNNTRLCFHVFSWPDAGTLIIPGVANKALKSFLLADAQMSPLKLWQEEEKILISLPSTAPDLYNSVVVLDIEGSPDICNPPVITAESSIFIDNLTVTISGERRELEIRYSTDGSEPTVNSPIFEKAITIDKTSNISARYFRNGKALSSTSFTTFTKVKPWLPLNVKETGQGIKYSFYEGDWEKLPDFSKLTPVKTGTLPNIRLKEAAGVERFGYEFTGYLLVRSNDVYFLTIASDDGSKLFIDGKLVADNDGLHSMIERKGEVPLAAGKHKIKVQYFEKTGSNDLKIFIKSRNLQYQPIPDNMLLY